MPLDHRQLGSRSPAVEAHLLGSIEFDACLALQHRLVYETTGRADGQITLLICEHPTAITIGRQGSRAHLHLARGELTSRQLEPRWVNRGGGCLVHVPGQLAIYPIVPLDAHGFSVGEYLNRLQAGLLAVLDDVHCPGFARPGRHGVWGNTGQLAAVGVAVKNWVAYFGAYLNVAPALYSLRWADSDPIDGTAMSSLAVERRHPVRMSGVREALVRQLAAAFGCQRYHLYTGHPLVASYQERRHVPAARVG
jgi:lipoyl(octanoyl) transferase